MRPLRFVPFLLALCGFVSAQITGDGPPAPVTPGGEPPEFEVLESRTEKALREEPAPLPDMEPVRKVVDVTVQVVKDPQLPEPAETGPVAADPERAAELRARLAARQRTVFLSLSAAVHDHEATLLRWWPRGNRGPQYTAWSNVDWELLAGHGKIVHEGVEYQLFIGLHLEDSAARRRLAERFGKPYVPVPIPALPPDETAAFVVTEGDAADTAATAAITALHGYFQAHRQELVAARDARKEAQRQREAQLRANPPEPENVHLRIWKREPADTPATTIP